MIPSPKRLVENAHQMVHGLLRTWVTSMERWYHTNTESEFTSCASGWSLTRYTILEDGFDTVQKIAQRRVRRRDR